MVRLAVWTSQYPEPYETFIQGETEHLIEQHPGSTVHVLKGGDGLRPPYVQWHRWWSPSALLMFWVCCLSRTSAMVGILRDLWGGFRDCARRFERLKSFVVWPLACQAYHQFTRQHGPEQADPEQRILQLAHWTNVPSTIAWMIRRLGGPGYVMVVHGENLSSTWPLLQHKLDEAAEVLSCTQFNANRLAAAGLRKPVVCPHGVAIPSDSLPLLGGGQGEGLEQRELKGLSVGRLVPTKGFHILLEALAKLEGDWTWTFVGDGPERAALEAQATRLGLRHRITFTGRLPHHEVLSLYPQHPIFALPFIRNERGDSDGLPNALLEAMAAGCAVIASNDAAAPEAIVQGVSGLLVEPGSVTSLREALAQLKANENLLKQLGTGGRAVTMERYERKSCVERLATHFNDLKA
ncbi:MAG: glycosyltransferase family 4 protein [Planctomycetota bacterium]